MAYAIVTGEQGESLDAADTVMTEPKHYCVHGIPESGTNCSPARVGTREVETAYLPVFEAGIKKPAPAMPWLPITVSTVKP